MEIIKYGAIFILITGCFITTLALCKAASVADAAYEINFNEILGEQN